MGKVVVINKVEYTLNEDRREYGVSGFQDCRAPRSVLIESAINGLPVTAVLEGGGGGI